MAVFSTDGIENRPISGVRPINNIVIRVTNCSDTIPATPVVIDIYSISPATTATPIPGNFVSGTQTIVGTYTTGLGTFSTSAAAFTIDNFPVAGYDSFGVRITTPGSQTANPPTNTVAIAIALRDAAGGIVQRLLEGDLGLVG